MFCVGKMSQWNIYCKENKLRLALSFPDQQCPSQKQELSYTADRESQSPLNCAPDSSQLTLVAMVCSPSSFEEEYLSDTEIRGKVFPIESLSV